MKNLVWLLVSLLTSSNAFASGEFDPRGTGCTFRHLMTQFLKGEKGAPSPSTFLVAETVNHPENEFWVYWPQGREILLVGWPVRDCKNPTLTLRRRLRLSKDIVKNHSELGTSTYLETEEWTGQVLYSAAKSGYQVTVRRN